MKTLLVDDDDLGFLAELRKILTSCGHEVTLASDGVVAVEAYKQLWQTSGIDLVLTDLQMPRKTGIGVLKDIKALNPHARIWIHTQTTGVMFEIFQRNALELGAEKFLHKLQTDQELRIAGIIR